VPTNPEDKDESYKFPNLAQELICNSSLLCQVLLEGGRGIPQEPPEPEESVDAQSTQVTLGDESADGESSVKSKTLENPKVVVKSQEKLAGEDNGSDVQEKEEVLKMGGESDKKGSESPNRVKEEEDQVNVDSTEADANKDGSKESNEVKNEEESTD